MEIMAVEAAQAAPTELKMILFILLLQTGRSYGALSAWLHATLYGAIFSFLKIRKRYF